MWPSPNYFGLLFDVSCSGFIIVPRCNVQPAISRYTMDTKLAVAVVIDLAYCD